MELLRSGCEGFVTEAKESNSCIVVHLLECARSLKNDYWSFVCLSALGSYQAYFVSAYDPICDARAVKDSNDRKI